MSHPLLDWFRFQTGVDGDFSGVELNRFYRINGRLIPTREVVSVEISGHHFGIAMHPAPHKLTHKGTPTPWVTRDYWADEGNLYRAQIQEALDEWEEGQTIWHRRTIQLSNRRFCAGEFTFYHDRIKMYLHSIGDTSCLLIPKPNYLLSGKFMVTDLDCPKIVVPDSILETDILIGPGADISDDVARFVNDVLGRELICHLGDYV